LQGAVVILQGQVAGLLLSVANLSGRVDTLEGKVSTLETNVATLQSQVSVIQGQIVVIQGQITAINLRIDNLSATFDGDVQGSGLLSSTINLELMLTLDQIKKAQANVDLNNNKIVNLISGDVEQLDAINSNFLWDLMHDNVGVVWQ
jgi:outer membrane murein-binding lipoprotein Lpp